MNTQGRPFMTLPISRAGPSPKRVVKRWLTSEPRNGPALPAAIMTPTTAGERCRPLKAKKTTSSSAIPRPRLDTAEVSVRPSSSRLRMTSRRPWPDVRDETAAAAFWFRLRPPDEQQADHRGEERDRVGEHGSAHAGQADQAAGHRGPRHLRGGFADRQAGVGLVEVVGGDDVRQVRLVGRVEEDRRGTDNQAHDDELGEGHGAGEHRDRDGHDGGPAHKVGDQEHDLAAHPVDPGTGEQAEHRIGQVTARADQPELEWRGVAAQAGRRSATRPR